MNKMNLKVDLEGQQQPIFLYERDWKYVTKI